VQQSVVALDDSGNLTGLASITLSGNIVVSGTVDGRDVSALGATVDSLVAGGGSGDVVGPSSATDNRLTRFDGTTGKLIQQSLVTVDDSGNVSGVAALSMSGSITVSGTVDGRDVSTDGATLDGYATSKANRSLTIETVTGTTYTLVLADAQEKLKAFSSASPKTVTVPPNSSVAFAVGAVVPLYQSGAGLMTVAQGAGATVRPPRGGTLVADGQYAYLTLVKVATDEWKLLGEAAAA
jgi:hypothetical protein